MPIPSSGLNLKGHNLYPNDKKVDRSKFYKELQDPSVLRAFAGRMDKEVGNCSDAARFAWAETVFNRCASRKHSIKYELSNHSGYSYWPQFQSTPGTSDNKHYHTIIRKVCFDGTNISKGATGNGSLGVGVGRQTCKYDGESFGVEKADDKWWRELFPNLLKGLDEIIGDVVKVVVDAGKWVVRKLDEAFNPAEPPQHKPEKQRPYEKGTKPSDQQKLKPLELRPRQETPVANIWKINLNPPKQSVAANDTEPRPYNNKPRPLG